MAFGGVGWAGANHRATATECRWETLPQPESRLTTCVMCPWSSDRRMGRGLLVLLSGRSLDMTGQTSPFTMPFEERLATVNA